MSEATGPLRLLGSSLRPPVPKRTDSHLAVWQDRHTPPDCRRQHMLFIGGVSILLIGVGIIHRLWLPGGVNSTSLGWMSEQWLAEHRASHSP